MIFKKNKNTKNTTGIQIAKKNLNSLESKNLCG
jgi:hypothetical protein